jgi:hypothetical protein
MKLKPRLSVRLHGPECGVRSWEHAMCMERETASARNRATAELQARDKQTRKRDEEGKGVCSVRPVRPACFGCSWGSCSCSCAVHGCSGRALVLFLAEMQQEQNCGQFWTASARSGRAWTPGAPQPVASQRAGGIDRRCLPGQLSTHAQSSDGPTRTHNRCRGLPPGCRTRPH